MVNYFEWFKVAHIIAVISWMVGMLYLPRLYAYHAKLKTDSESYYLLQTMEGRLIKFIMTPSMIITYFFGATLAYIYGLEALGIWFHIKLLAVLTLSMLHGYFIICYKNFLHNSNSKSACFYKIINETVTVLMCIAIIMVIVKPFE